MKTIKGPSLSAASRQGGGIRCDVCHATAVGARVRGRNKDVKIMRVKDAGRDLTGRQSVRRVHPSLVNCAGRFWLSGNGQVDQVTDFSQQLSSDLNTCAVVTDDTTPIPPQCGAGDPHQYAIGVTDGPVNSSLETT